MAESDSVKRLLSTVDELKKRVAFLEAALRSKRKTVAAGPVNGVDEAQDGSRPLWKSEEHYRILFENALNPILIVNQECRYVDANDAGLQFLETDRDELLKKTVWDYSPEELSDSQKLEHSPFLGPRTLETVYQVNGKQKTLLLNVVPVQQGKETLLFGIGQDITGQKRQEAVMAARLRLLHSAQSMSLENFLRATLDECETLTGSKIGFYHFLDPDQTTISLQVWSTHTLKICKAEGSGRHYPVEEAGVWVDCVRERRTIVHNNYVGLANRKGLPPGHTEVVRELVVPVFRGEKIKAILGVGNKLADYTQNDIDTVISLADLAWDIAETKRVQDVLQQNELNYREIFNATTEAIFVHDAVTGDILDVNDAALSMFGCKTKEDVFAANKPDFSVNKPPFTKKDALKLIRMAVEQGPQIFEWQAITANGSPFWTEISLRCTQIDGQKRVLAVIRDISERKRTEMIIADAQETNRAIVENSPMGIVIYKANGQCVAANKAAGKILSLPVATILATNFHEIETWKHSGIYELAKQALSSGKIVSLEAESVVQSGAHLWLKVVFTPFTSGGELHLMKIFEDFTERRKVEAALKESECSFRKLVSAAPEGIFVQSDERFLFINQSMLKIFGAEKPEDMLTKDIKAVIPPENLEEVRARIRYQRESGMPVPPIEQEYLRLDGSRVFVEASAVALRFQGRDAHLVFVRDITERKQSEQNYREIFNATSEAIFVMEMHTLRILDINDAAFSMFGYETKEEFLAHEVWDIIVTDEPPYTIEEALHLRDAVEHGTQFFIWPALKKNSERFWVEVALRGTKIGEKGRLLAVLRDITERKQVEEARQQWADAFECSGFGMAMGNPHTNRVIACNPAFAKMFKGSADQIIGSRILDLYVPTEHQQVKEHILYADREGHAQYIAHMVRKDGSTFPVQVDLVSVRDNKGALLYRVATVQDISERKQAQRERELLTAAIEQADETVVITDTNGAIQYTNPAFEHSTGYSCQEAIGQNPRILKSGKQDDAFYAAMWDTLVKGHVWEGRFINKRKDGSFYTEEAVISPVRDTSGAVVNYVAVKRDITHELEIEQQFLQAQKMESVGRLAGGVAHDFNNLLTVILSYTELCMHSIPSDNPAQKWLREITDAGLRSANITRQLLAFARKQNISPVVLDLNKAVVNMLKLLRRLIGEDIRLTWIPSTDLWSVKLDPSQVDQILANLCVNARDAISGVGKITIETRNLTADDKCTTCSDVVTQGEYVMLKVSDDGCGMEKDILDHIFDPFFTTKSSDKGTGLGLATVYGIVKQNSGHISVESEPGKGTTFTIFIPRYEEQSEEPADSDSIKESPKSRGETILVVEDDKAIRMTCALLLDSLGYKVHVAATPTAAMDLHARYQGGVDLLLTDVVMPEMNGRELAKQLGQLNPGLKVLYMSGYTADVIDKHVLEQGINFIEKPFTLTDLSNKIREVLDQS